MVHFEVTDVIRTVKYCNFSSYIMKLQYLKCILTRFFFFQKSKLNKPSFHMRFTNPALSEMLRSFFQGFHIHTVQSRALTRVTIQEIKSLGVLQFEFYVVKGGATNRDMSLTETCQCSRLYGTANLDNAIFTRTNIVKTF